MIVYQSRKREGMILKEFRTAGELKRTSNKLTYDSEVDYSIRQYLREQRQRKMEIRE